MYVPVVSMWEAELDKIAAQTHFSGVVRVDCDDTIQLVRAFGLAHRGYDMANTVDTQFGIASGGKAFTALAVVSLIEDGVLSMSTTARSVLGDDLPLIGPEVTVEHLLTHRSGIGDYFDEDAGGDTNDYVLTSPVHELAHTEAFLRELDGFPPKFVPDERFSYCNSGYVVLALIAERGSCVPYHQLVRQRVCDPGGLQDTGFLRSDEFGGRVARGYLTVDGPRTNIFHLPVLGNGDGGIYSTAADIHSLWAALIGGRIVPPHWVTEMVRPRSDVPEESARYGIGFWLDETGPAVMLVGGDAGGSFRSVHDPVARYTHTVLSNTSDGAWPITRRLDELLTA